MNFGRTAHFRCFLYGLILVSLAMLTTGCNIGFQVKKLAGSTYSGCTSASMSEDYKQVKVTFESPSEATKIRIIRDGELVFSEEPKGIDQFNDASIEEGKTYTYSCFATFENESMSGEKTVSITVPTGNQILGDQFLGCVSGVSLSTSEIQLTYQWPTTANAMKIVRNDVDVYSPSIRTGSEMTWTDVGLQEGESFVYKCIAAINGSSLVGPNAVTVRTLTTNPPTFSGVSTAVAASPSTAMLTWSKATGTKASTYKIYASIGSTIDWSTPVSTVNAPGTSVSLSTLGDELPYIVGVRACNVDGACDSNTTTRTFTTPDGGTPTTLGATAAATNSGAVEVTAPWSPSQGGLGSRFLYRKTGGAVSTNIADYTLIRTYNISSGSV